MSLMDHVLNLFGPGGLKPSDIKPGFTVTKIDWRGCMATDRRVDDVGDLVRLLDHGRYAGAMVQYDKSGLQWEPLDHFRRVNGELEVWS
jgi:hypothetical protein